LNTARLENPYSEEVTTGTNDVVKRVSPDECCRVLRKWLVENKLLRRSNTGHRDIGKNRRHCACIALGSGPIDHDWNQ